ncbi:MAG: RHS repeat protein [Betaproteobacteria bacterium]|nr:RHS repeat protein [Betaproteobacteria bacterium]
MAYKSALGGCGDGRGGYGSLDCLNYPLMTIQGRTYKKNDSQNVWALEFRYSVSATEYFEGEGCLAKRIRKLRWFDNMSKEWMEYERTDPGVLSFRLIRYGGRNDNSVSLIYDESGKLTEVRDRFDNPVLNYIYTNGQLTEIRDVPVNGEAARAVKYGWGSSVVDGKSVPVITQVTDVLGNVTSYTVQNGKLTSVTDPEGRTRKYAYTSDRVTSYTDALGHVTTYVYDYDRMKQEFYVRIKSPDGVQTENWYDNEGVLIWRMVAGQTLYKRGKVDPVSRTEIRIDGAGRETKITRDEFRNLTKTEYPDGSSTSAKYSVQHGRVSEETDELGVKTAYEYDAIDPATKY